MEKNEQYLKAQVVVDVVYDLDASGGALRNEVSAGLYNQITSAIGGGLLTSFDPSMVVDSHSTSVFFPDDKVVLPGFVTFDVGYHSHHEVLARETKIDATPAVIVKRSVDTNLYHYLMRDRRTNQWCSGYYETLDGNDVVTDIEAFDSFRLAKEALSRAVGIEEGGVFEHPAFEMISKQFSDDEGAIRRNTVWSFVDDHPDLQHTAAVTAVLACIGRRVFMSYLLEGKLLTVGYMHRLPGHEEMPFEKTIKYVGYSHDAALRTFFECAEIDPNMFNIEGGPVGSFFNYVSSKEKRPIVMEYDDWAFRQFNEMTGGPTVLASGIIGGKEVLAYISFDSSTKRWFYGHYDIDMKSKSDVGTCDSIEGCLGYFRVEDVNQKIVADEGLKSLISAYNTEIKSASSTAPEAVDIGHGKVFDEAPVSFTSCHYELDYHAAIHGFVNVGSRKCLAFLCFDEDRNPPWEVGAWVYDGEPDATCEYEQKGFAEFEDAKQAFIDIFRENKQSPTGLEKATMDMLRHAASTLISIKYGTVPTEVKPYEDQSRIDFYEKDSENDDQGVLMFLGTMEDHKLVYRQDNGPAYLEIIHTKYRPGIGLNDKSSVEVKDTWSMIDAIAEMLRIKNITPNDLEKSVVENFTNWVKNQIRQKYDRDMELFN
jgi:hypothetical protein